MAGQAFTGMAKCLDTLTAKSAYTLPSLFGALDTTTPTASTGATEITTGQYGGYARIAFTGSSWAGASAGSTAYNALLDFNAASSSTGTNVLGVEFFDASSAGVRLWWEGLTSIPITSGTHISFASGQFVATMATISAGIGLAATYANALLDHMTGKTSFALSNSTLFLALGSTAATTTPGTELPYTGYARLALGTADINAAATVSTNVDVVTNVQKNFGADTAGTQTAATFWYLMTAISSGSLIAGGSISNGSVAAGLTPDFPSGSTILRLN